MTANKIVQFLLLVSMLLHGQAVAKTNQETLASMKSKLANDHTILAGEAFFLANRIYEQEPTEGNAENLVMIYDQLNENQLKQVVNIKEKRFQEFYQTYSDNGIILTSYCWDSLVHHQTIAKKVCRNAFMADKADFVNHINLGHVFFAEGNSSLAKLFFHQAIIGLNEKDLAYVLEDFVVLTKIYPQKKANKMVAWLKDTWAVNHKHTHVIYEKLTQAIETENDTDAIVYNQKLLKVIEKTIGKKSFLYPYYLQLQASFFSNVDDMEKSIALREQVNQLYGDLSFAQEDFVKQAIKENQIRLSIIKAFKKIDNDK